MTDPVREFIGAFNARDLDRLIAVLDPEVEIHSKKGLVQGVEAARVWATRKRGGVQQTIELAELFEDRTEDGGGRAVALIIRHWHWDEEEGEKAGEEAMAWTFELHGDRIRSWRSYEDRSEALQANGFGSAA